MYIASSMIRTRLHRRACAFIAFVSAPMGSTLQSAATMVSCRCVLSHRLAFLHLELLVMNSHCTPRYGILRKSAFTESLGNIRALFAASTSPATVASSSLVLMIRPHAYGTWNPTTFLSYPRLFRLEYIRMSIPWQSRPIWSLSRQAVGMV
jgi:hypothetical protein